MKVTIERLKELVSYDPLTGRWTILVAFGRRKVGQLIPLCKHRTAFHIDGQKYRSYRLAWFYMTGEWPALGVDHINGIANDDRWDNLRQATSAQNNRNSKRRSDNKSGIKGVFWDKRDRKWRAHIGKRCLGYFNDIETAKKVRHAAATALYGEFVRHD